MRNTIARRSLRFSFVALVVLVGGCVPPTFENPVPPPEQPAADEALLGAWVSRDDGAEALIAFFAVKSSQLDVVYVVRKTDPKNPDEHVLLFDGYNTHVGGDKLLCLKSRALGEGPREFSGYVMAAYRFAEDGTLRLSVFSDEKVKGLIEANALKGRIAEGTGSVEVTASAEEVTALIAQKGVGAFISKEQEMCLTRQGRRQK